MDKRIINLKSDPTPYLAEGVLIWCSDHKFEDLYFEVDKVIFQFKPKDPLVIPGGIKDLASPSEEADRVYVLKRIEMLIELHKARTIFGMAHSHCGAYGDLLPNTPQEEYNYLRHELEKFETAVRNSFLLEKYPNLQVVKLLADFEGLVRIG